MAASLPPPLPIPSSSTVHVGVATGCLSAIIDAPETPSRREQAVFDSDVQELQRISQVEAPSSRRDDPRDLDIAVPSCAVSARFGE
jgi:hypothetical protein